MIKPVVSRVAPQPSADNPRSSLRLAGIKALAIIAFMTLLCSAHQAGATSVPTTTTLAVTSGGSAVTTVTSETVVTLTATVLAGTTPVTVGQINFCNAAAKLCTDINLLATAQLTSAGTGTFKFRPGVGSHSYKAVFVGTPHGSAAYAGSTSSAAALTVTGLNPSITTTAPAVCNSPNFAATNVCSPANYTLTATVSGNDSTVPTGTVSFLNSGNGNAVLGTAALGAGTSGTSFLNVTNSELATIITPWPIAAGDFNGDGIPDLAVASQCGNDPTCESGGTVTVLLGNGDGTFTQTTTSPAAIYDPESIIVGDFNGDGVLDLAVHSDCNNSACDIGMVTVFLGNGDGTFTATATSLATGNGGAFVMAEGDFNGDGIQDLVLANTSGNNLTVLLGNGDGTFTATATSPATGYQPWSIGVGDFNGDGNLDLAVTNYLGNGDPDTVGTVTILLGNGDGTFTAAASPTTGEFPLDIAVGDFNGDGIPDLVVANTGVNDLTVLLGKGNGTFMPAASPTTGNGPISIAVGDFNGDGIPDLAVPGLGDGTLTVLRGNGNGTFSTEETLLLEGDGGLMGIASADFNGDGVPDVAVSVLGNGPVNMYGEYGGGVTTFLTANYTATATDAVVLPAGTGIQQVFANYAGDSNYGASASGAVAARMAPTVTVESFSGITTTQNLAVTIAVSVPYGDPTPTGSVTLSGGSFTSAATAVGTTSVQMNIESAQITIPAGTLAIGSHTLAATYTPSAYSSTVYTNSSGSAVVTVAVPATLTPSSGTLATSQTFNWNNGVGVTEYQLFLGTTGYGSSDIYNSDATTVTSATVSIPADGETVYALFGQFIGEWQYTRYTFTAPVVLATLTPSTGVLTPSQTFTWSNGVESSSYVLWLGTAGLDSNDLYNSHETTATSATVSIPSKGVTVFATLKQLIGGTWHSTGYTYTEPGTLTPATLTPSSGTLSASQIFTWNNGVGPAEYVLWLGTTGPGTSDLYNSHETTATTATVSIPSHGVTIFATLKQQIDGVWQQTAYTFTEPGTSTPATLTPSTGVLSASQTFTWSNGVGPASYVLWLGTTGVDSNDLYNSHETTATSTTVSIPAHGVTVFATLKQQISGTWQSTSYTLTEPGTPTLATLIPSSGTLSASETFVWSNGAGPASYVLWLGTTGPGSSDLFNSHETKATLATVSIPSNGVTVFATLKQLISGTWQQTAYTFTEPGTATPAALTPSSGTLSTSQTFTWSNGVGPASYVLWLGTTGPNSNDLYNSHETTGTSATISIPSNGVTVYATLKQQINGTWRVTSYTFTEP